MSSKKYQQISHLVLLAVLGSALPSYAKDDLSDWKLPPIAPSKGNPQSEAKVALGKQLAFDIRLSKNDSMSCADCHLPATGGAGPTPRAFGHGGELGRWAPSWGQLRFTILRCSGTGAPAHWRSRQAACPARMGPVHRTGRNGGVDG